MPAQTPTVGMSRKLAAIYSELGKDVEVRVEAAEVLRINPKFSLEVHKERVPIKDPVVLERHIAALHKTGLKMNDEWERRIGRWSELKVVNNQLTTNNPSRINNCLVATAWGEFNTRACSVALPAAVTPRIVPVSRSSVKCSRQCWTRGLKREVVSAVIGSVASILRINL